MAEKKAPVSKRFATNVCCISFGNYMFRLIKFCYLIVQQKEPTASSRRTLGTQQINGGQNANLDQNFGNKNDVKYVQRFLIST